MDLSGMAASELIRLSRAALVELVDRGTLSTWNAPQGEWAEMLVAAAFGGVRAPGNTAGWDVQVGDELIQVKSSAAENLKQFSAFRSGHFTSAVFVRFDHRDFTVKWARKIARTDIDAQLRPADYISAKMITGRSASLAGEDITELVQAAEGRIDEVLTSVQPFTSGA